MFKRLICFFLGHDIEVVDSVYGKYYACKRCSEIDFGDSWEV